MEITYEKLQSENEKYLDNFYKWLIKKNLSDKTINSHYNNVDFYLNSYLCNYELESMQNGCDYIGDFLGDWFIRKAMWSTPSTVKSSAASIKKFYLCMLENNLIKNEDYETLCTSIKTNMTHWIQAVEKYNTKSNYLFM